MTSARKRPVFGDCEQEDGPFAEGDRTRDCSAYVRTDLIMHRVTRKLTPQQCG
jgi:hypothetical protein